MGWIRLDDRFAEHEKVLDLTDREFRVHVNALCYTARAQSPRIPKGAFGLLGATPKIVGRLEAVGLWDVDGDSWVIHDWDEYQRRDDTNAERQRRYREKRRNGTVTRYVTAEVTDGNAR